MITTFLVEAKISRTLGANRMLFTVARSSSFPFLIAIEHPGRCPMTVTVDADQVQAERTVANLYKLVDVLSVEMIGVRSCRTNLGDE